jgi:TonB-dependent receptor
MLGSQIRRRLLATVSFAMLAGAGAVHAADTPAANAESANVESVVITAPRQEELARAEQKSAPVIVNVQSAETIYKYPDYNAAEALGRIPGISLSSDTGEGRFVNIRGIDANLNGATYGGVVLLNTFAAGTAASGGGRAVEFDTIPTGAIDGIVVYKTLSPDREAEGLGGQIELTPRTAKNIKQPFIEADLGWGYEDLHEHTGPFTASVAAGARFGFNNGKLVVEGDGQDKPVGSGWISNPTPFSIVITGSRKDDRRGIDDTEPSYANDGASGVNNGTCGIDPKTGGCDHVLGRVDFRRYDYHRRRFGYGGELDFKPNDNHSYYIRLDVAGYKERAHKNHWYANLDGAPSAPDAKGYVVDTFQPQLDVVDLEETHRNTVYAMGGDDQFGKLEVDYRAAYSRATYVENYYNELRFYGADAFYVRYNNTINPKHFYYQFFNDAALTSPFVSTNIANYYNAASPKTGMTAFFENDADEEFSYVLNARYPLNLWGFNGDVKGGVSVRLRDKVVTDFGGGVKLTGAAAPNPALFSQSVGPGVQYYNGWFPPAPYVDVYAMRNYVRTNYGPLAPSLGRDFKDNENVYAGYIMYTGEWDKLGLMTGVRYESTDAKYGNYLNNASTFVTRSKTYDNLFPTVQLKYTRRSCRCAPPTPPVSPVRASARPAASPGLTPPPRPIPPIQAATPTCTPPPAIISTSTSNITCPAAASSRPACSTSNSPTTSSRPSVWSAIRSSRPTAARAISSAISTKAPGLAASSWPRTRSSPSCRPC